MKVLVTGARGFIGSRLCVALMDDCEVIQASDLDLNEKSSWAPLLKSVDLVVHCAARAHVVNDSHSNPREAFLKVNWRGTENLLRQASANRVQRFIYLSTIAVSGDSSVPCAPFHHDSAPNPERDFAFSKYKAEEAVRTICAETGMEYVIIRPPLVYGAGVKANFLSMLKWVSHGVPLPLGGIKTNKRSLVYVDTLVDLIKVCIEHPAAANQTFLVSDDDDVSTRELLERVATALGVKSCLLPIPPAWLGFAGKLLGKKDVERRLCGSMQVDIEHTKQTLGWTPPYSMEEGLLRTAKWYKEGNR